MRLRITENATSITFAVRVTTRAACNEIVGEHDGALKVRIAAPPVDGAANEALIRLLAKQLGVSRSHIEIVGGETSKSKRIKISNLSRSKLEEMFT